MDKQTCSARFHLVAFTTITLVAAMYFKAYIDARGMRKEYRIAPADPETTEIYHGAMKAATQP